MDAAPTPITPRSDLTPARWLVGTLTAFGSRVDQLLPAGCPAYVRLFHRPDHGNPAPDADATWAAAARRHGTVLHPAAQWQALTRGGGPGSDPLEGSLDRLSLDRLARHVGRHTSTPDQCYLALWEGYGTLPDSWLTRPRVELPGRSYLLFGPTPADTVNAYAVEFEVAGLEEQSRSPGGIPGLLLSRQGLRAPSSAERAAASAEFARRMREQGASQSPTLWWPEDRAWIVLSEIDLDCTLIGCSLALRDDLLADPDLECLEVDPTTSLAYDADRINGDESGPGRDGGSKLSP